MRGFGRCLRCHLMARALRYAPVKVRLVAHRTENAAGTIGQLAKGDRVTGVTAGQFSAIDAMEHMVDQLGPADVRVSTWTSGLYDAQRAAAIRVEGRIKQMRMLLDRGTFEKSPKFAGPLIERLGVNSFRCLGVHAKVIIVSGERGRAVMRSSMNLNKNLRTEQFDIDVCEEMADFYERWFDLLWDESEERVDNRKIIQAVYDRFIAERALLAEKEKAAPKSKAQPVSEEGFDGQFGLDDFDTWSF